MADQNFPIVLAHGIARFDILHRRLREKVKLSDTELSDKFSSTPLSLGPLSFE